MVTRSKGSKSLNKLSKDSPKQQSVVPASKIPRLNKTFQGTNLPSPKLGTASCHYDTVVSSSDADPPNLELQTLNTNPGGSESGRLFEVNNIAVTHSNSRDSALDGPIDQPNILSTLANINQRLKKLDKLDEMSSSLTGEINTVQSQVGEVANQVSMVKTDLNRCEEKWEENTSTMLGRIEKVEQGLQAFDQKWEAGNSNILKDISSLQANMELNASRVGKLEEELARHKEKWESLGALERKIKVSANDKFKELKGTIIDEVREELSQEIQSSERERKYESLKGRAFNKRHNIVMFGLPENPSQEEDLKAASTFFSSRMGLLNMGIEVAYRIGTAGTRPRPLVVRFKDIQDRWAVWNRKGKIKYEKGVPVWLQEDLPKRLREDYRVLQRIAKVARSCPEKFKEVRVKDYKISINHKKYDCDNLHLLPSELSPAMVYTPCSEHACVFFTKHSPFSNHFASSFTLEGVQFSCIEQYLAVQKAHLADNKDLAREAMGSSNPADHKVVLNKLKSEVSDEWKKRAPEFIKAAVEAKFSQNPHLTKFLLDSHPLQIGEASRDSFWGIGLSLESPDALDTTKWVSGGNLLGRTLVSFREKIMETANFPSN